MPCVLFFLSAMIDGLYIIYSTDLLYVLNSPGAAENSSGDSSKSIRKLIAVSSSIVYLRVFFPVYYIYSLKTFFIAITLSITP